MDKSKLVSYASLTVNSFIFIGITIFLLIFLILKIEPGYENIIVTQSNFSDGIAPEPKIEITNKEYFTDNAVLSVFSREPLKFKSDDIDFDSYQTLTGDGYYYELKSYLDFYGSHNITVSLEDIAGNETSYDYDIERISLYDQTISLDYISGDKDSKIITDIDTETILEGDWRLPASYKPGDLQLIEDIPTLGKLYLRKEALDALYLMYEDMEEAGIEVFITSAYRSFQSQTYTYNYISSVEGETAAKRKAAVPGYSEHQLGLAIDLVNAETNYVLPAQGVTTRLYNWLEENANDYGFIKTYDGSDDEISEEIWHWRYVSSSVSVEDEE